MSDWAQDAVGDNIEFTAVTPEDYEVFLQHNDNTSNDDEEFIKYPNNQDGRGGSGATARKFILRTDQNVDIVSINGLVFTNPIAVIKNKAHIEKRGRPIIFKMKIRTPTANTAIKVRWF